MIDRLVCADGGNPDPTATAGKNPSKAKTLEMAGWDYPQHLAGRAYGLIVHGDVAGIDRAAPAGCRRCSRICRVHDRSKLPGQWRRRSA